MSYVYKKVCMLCATAEICTACSFPPILSNSLNVTGWSPLFITTTTTCWSGVRKAVASRVEPSTTFDTLTEPRGINLLSK